MPGSPEGRYRGGMTTLERYGREHYARITKGRARRVRFTPKGVTVGRPTSPSAPTHPRFKEATQNAKR